MLKIRREVVSRDDVCIHVERLILPMAYKRWLRTGVRGLPANLEPLVQSISQALIDAPTEYGVDCPDPDCT